MAIKSVSIRIEEEMLEKLGFVADYEGRSVNSHILVLIRENIKKFEEQNGEINGSIRPDVTVMKESQVAVMEEFVDNVKILINALGYKVLDPLLQISTNAAATDGEELFINTGNTSATGMVTSEGFVVLKGAVVNEKTSAKSLSAGMKKLRDRIFADGKVENMTTTEDILFSSSSAAAEFVLGYSASGPRTWKAKDGRTLKEIEDNATVD